jgi:hypothetical protein
LTEGRKEGHRGKTPLRRESERGEEERERRRAEKRGAKERVRESGD